MSRRDRPLFAVFWFQWIMASTLGWLLGQMLFPYLPVIAGGVGVGVLQWPVLYRRLDRAWRWPLVTAPAWIGGSILLMLTPPAWQPLLSGALPGLAVGLAQWLILRRAVRWAGWWIAISLVAWITGLTLLPGLLSTGALVGAATGVALYLLLRSR